MTIKDIEIRNFRNYEKTYLKFSETYNLIYGNNGQGKTNLLEAIYILGLVKGFRAISDNNLIKYNEDYYYIKGNIEYQDDDFNNDLDNSTILEKSLEMGFSKVQVKQLKIVKIIILKFSD